MFGERNSLPKSFYNRSTLIVAKELLGKTIVHQIDKDVLAGKIVETEAYIGEDDPACHAARGKTNRTALMYGPPGFVYIYFIYGMYYCLNAVTEAENFPAAVLIRAVEPLVGIKKMQQLRGTSNLRNLTTGPGKLCMAFGLDKSQNGVDLYNSELRIAEGETIAESEIATTTRIGISAGKDFPWRFYIKRNKFVSV